MEEREFHVSNTYATTRWAAWALLAFAILELSVLYFDPPQNLGGIVVFVLGGAFFLGLSAWGFLLAKNVRKYSVAIDSEGIRSLDPKRAQVKLYWSDLAKIKERAHRQRLELFDRRGEKVINVEYQLEGFEDLRKILMDRVGRNTTVRLPVRYTKGWFFHILYWGLMAMLSYASYYYYVPRPDSWLFVGLLVVALAILAREYLKQVIAITVSNDALLLYYPLWQIKAAIPDITDIGIHDEYVKSSRVPHVLITLRNGKTYKVGRLDINATELVSVLNYAKNQGNQ